MLSALGKLRNKLKIAATYKQATKGCITAQYEIGHLYHELGGDHLPQAFAWLSIASDHGHMSAVSELSALEAKLPQNQLEEGRELAAEYKRNYDTMLRRKRKHL